MVLHFRQASGEAAGKKKGGVNMFGGKNNKNQLDTVLAIAALVFMLVIALVSMKADGRK